MYDKITLPTLINMLSEKTGKSKKLCEDFLREFFGTLVDTLGAGENVKIKGIGTFKVVEVEPRKSVNVNTGEEMEIPGHRKITFIPAKEMAEDVNSPFAMFESVEIGDEVEEESDTVEEIEEEQPSIPEPPAVKEPMTVKEVIQQALDTTEQSPEEIEESVDAEEPAEIQSEEEFVEAPAEEEVEEPVEEHPEASTEEAAEEEIEEPSGEPAEEPSEETIDESFPEYEYYEEEPKKKYHFLWGFLCGLFCTAIVVAICYFLLADKLNAMMGSFQDKDPATPMVVATQPVPADTVNESTDSVPNDSVNQKIVENKEKETELKEVAPTKPSDEIVYDTISNSKNKVRYLTTMAKVHYGNYNLWPIIYEENKAILGHPDRIRPGTRVVIPPLSKYGVDPNNPDDIAKAKKKGVEIYARFK